MYEINVSSRRVTQYIIDESYRWLYKKIAAGEYQANSSKPGKALLLQIEEEQAVSPENYEQFVELFENSPYSYMMYRKKKKNSKRITTDQLLNYFISYNGHVLPLGFVKDFFEDDYETEREISELVKKFADSEKSATSIQWKKTLINRENDLDNVQAIFPNMFRVNPTLLITQILRLIVTGFMIFMVLTFLKQVAFWDVMGVFCGENGFDVKKEFTSAAPMVAYDFDGNAFLPEGGTFTLGEYFGHYAVMFIWCLIVIIMLIPKIKASIIFLIFLGRIVWNKLRVVYQKYLISNFEKKGIDTIGNYFVEVAPDLAAAREINDTHCAGIPKISWMYNAVDGFNMKKMREKLAKLNPKYYGKKFAYEEKDLPTVKAVWRKGLVGSIVFAALMAIVFVPALNALIMPSIGNLVGSIFG